jgi:hypothetical protein
VQQSQCQQASRDFSGYDGLKKLGKLPQFMASNSFGYEREMLEPAPLQ